MNTNQMLYWHQGLFLQPQHFQQNDAVLEHRLSRTVELLHPYPWGVISLAINESALGARQCQLDQLSVRFAEGTLVEYPGNSMLQARSLDLGEFVGGGRTLYVGLRRLSPDGKNAQVFETLSDGAQAEARFVVAAEPEVVSDQFSVASPAHVRAMSYVLRLFWEEELEHLGAYELLPILRLELEGDRLRPAAWYVPPCLNLAGAPILEQRLRDLRNELLGRARQLSVFKLAPGGSYGEVNGTQLNRLLALNVLNRYGPLLTHFLNAPQVSLLQIYSSLHQLVSELSQFSDRCDSSGEAPDGRSLIRGYNHSDAGLIIIELIALIGQMLSDINVGSEMVVRLHLQGGYQQADLPDAFFGARHRYFLVAHSQRGGAWLAETLPCNGKLGTPGSLGAMVARALPGVELIHLQTPPQGLPRASDAEYFRLETVSEAWDHVQRERQVALFLPDEPDDLRVELMVVCA
ncbi:type VI secretion system baseplate subunit TssK [Pseudomonas plecoglossicida]|uniref:Type VI secretion system baseplate subunit TssK n=1 Tax=Pseudomonas plecoglossicida TaxID=70775 RepID=A0AAD0VT37_PSEDL|nr:type VI secretion system baseplate subunit TssK [Pseudomonas plecoglossicida]AXM95516.1 type VI secretion system baseplate subunit TssK [Pseudomonas plecoglossicida]QLB56264.1 type VI secretion system baseplate subunit TssK [Pseudomonas plecoglossicida]